MNENYDYLALNFYRKARFFYNVAIEKEQKGKESMSMAKNLGPDLGQELRLRRSPLSRRTFRVSLTVPKEDSEKRIEALTKSKRAVARIFRNGGRRPRTNPRSCSTRPRNSTRTMTKELETVGVKATTPEEDAKNG